MKIDKRKSIQEPLENYCVFADRHAHIEVCEWINGEGVDIEIHSNNDTQLFQMTFGQFKALKKIMKRLYK